MNYRSLQNALDYPALMLGVLPELRALRPQFEVHLFDELASTSRTAWELVDQGAGSGTVVIAQQQSAGRGQWGRTWVSGPGGLYLSLVLEPNLAIADAALLTLASAWGIAIGLANLGVPIQLKWPNDLVSQGRKVGGILTETRVGLPAASVIGEYGGDNRLTEGETLIQTAVVGVGLNWANEPPPNGLSLLELLPDHRPASLKSLEGLAAIVLRGVLQGYQYWQHRGTSALIDVYCQKFEHLGCRINIDGHLGEVLGVSHQGHLTIGFDVDGQNLSRCFKPGEITLSYNG